MQMNMHSMKSVILTKAVIELKTRNKITYKSRPITTEDLLKRFNIKPNQIRTMNIQTITGENIYYYNY